MSNVNRAASADDRTRTIRTIATVVGATFLLVGILGFIPGITTHYGSMNWAGHMSDAKLLGIFQVSVLHNIVHLLYGVVGLAAARSARSTVAYLIVGGIIYLVLWIYGMSSDKMSNANFVPLNTADDWLHFVLGIGMVALGLFAARALRGTTATATAR